MVTFYLLFVALVGLERLLELRISARNAAWAMARGAQEAGAGHWLPMRLLHTGLLLGCVVEPLWLQRPLLPLQLGLFGAVVLAAQALRYWAIYSLGPCWNVRVLVVPGIEARCGGPYRWLRHPNYVAVVLEGLALPLMANAWLTAAAFFLLNAWLLRVRIQAEQDLLLRLANNYARVAGGPT